MGEPSSSILNIRLKGYETSNLAENAGSPCGIQIAGHYVSKFSKKSDGQYRMNRDKIWFFW